MDDRSITVTVQCERSSLWDEWIAALVADEFNCVVIDGADEHASGGTVEYGSIILLDGTLIDLAERVESIVGSWPNVRVIVATPQSSFEVYNKVVRHGAIYMADLESPEHFMQTFRKAIRYMGSSDNSLPNWL